MQSVLIIHRGLGSLWCAIILSTFFSLFFSSVSVAQYSTEVQDLRKTTDLFDERGYAQNGAISVDGSLTVSHSNGNVSYSYPISDAPISGVPLDVRLNYVGSVQFTAFKEFDGGNPASPYARWSQFHQSRPAWIVSAGNFAVQVISSNSMFHCDPARFLGAARYDFNDSDMVWLCDGYDFGNRMESLWAASESQYGFVDHIRLLRGDGSILELVNKKTFDPNQPTQNRSDLFTGHYYVNEANAHGFAVVSYDTNWAENIKAVATASLPNGPFYPYMPRVVRYYDGSLEYVFREWTAGYGLNAYGGRGVTPTNRFGNTTAGPTIFYLDQINSNSGGIVHFKRSRHVYPPEVPLNHDGNIYDPVLTNIDSTTGRALTTDFGEISIGYGDVGMTIQAYGRTTKVRFAKILPSGNAWRTTSMPLASRGYWTKTADQLSTLLEMDAGSALYDSYLGYVTEIADPEGRITKFEYEPYTRKYVNYNFPIPNQQGHDVSLTCKNYRLNRVIEPSCYYTITYAPYDFMGGGGPVGPGSTGRIDNTRSATLRPTDGEVSPGVHGIADNHAFWQNNVASYVKKFDKTNTLLTTMECEYQYLYPTGFVHGTHRMYDNLTGKVRKTEQDYRVHELTDPVPYVPIPHFTELRTSIDSAEVITTTTTIYQHPSSTQYMWLPSEQTTVVAGVTKMKQTMTYEYDTVRTFEGNANLAGKFGIEVKKQVVTTLDPSKNIPLWRDTTEYLHFRLIDTNLTRLDTILLKFETLANWFAMRDTLGLRWEDAMFDPRVRVFKTDSSVEHNILPPIYGLVKRQVRADRANNIIGGHEYEYTAMNDSSHYLNGLMYRGTPLRDWTISAGAAMKIRNDSNVFTRNWGRNLIAKTFNANGAAQRFNYDGYYSSQLRQSNGSYKAVGRVRSNDNTIRDTVLPQGGYFTYAFEKPLISESHVRKYTPSILSGTPATDTILRINQYTFYGLLSGFVDENRNYAQYRYDKNGRLSTMWAPSDFPRRDTIDTVRYQGTATIPLIGYTKHTYSIDTVHCDSAKLFSGPSKTDVLTNLYAGHSATDLPSCPCPPQGYHADEKDNSRVILESCNVFRPFVNNDYYTGYLDVVVDSTSPILTADVIDSLYLTLHPMAINGECVFMTVAIPEFNYSQLYLFNCEGGAAPMGTIFANNDYLKVDLSSVKSNILALGIGGGFTVKISVSTAERGVEFVNGVNAEDTRPQLVLKGTFTKESDLTDYTLAYTYQDDSLKTTVSAKVDDIRHTSNYYDLAAQNGSTVRRAVATHFLGADGRVLKTEVKVREHGVTRTDSVLHTYAGNGARTRTADEEGDTTVTKYDAMNRPVEIINADGTHATITYTIGTPASFGIDSVQQDFLGFCSAKTITNENGIKAVEYYDALDRLRRQVVDSGGAGAHLNLTTRYNYDLFGRLAEIINPKGDTISYWYDYFGRVQQKRQPDLGVISYAYDKLGNVRFVQNQEQADKGRLLFNEYDDLNRLVVVGEAVLGANPNRPTFEDDGYQGAGGWLYGHVHTPDFFSKAEKKEKGQTILSAPVSRVTDNMDATILHIGAGSTSVPVTANPTLWRTPQSQVPATWTLPQTLYSYCSLQPDTTFLNETSAPMTPLFRHPVTFHVSPSGPGAGFTDFEDLAKYPHFARIAISYDTLPFQSGPIWGAFPSHLQWDSLTPFYKVRNTKGREAAIAYREHGGAPWHFMVMSYDERGRVEALLRWTDNIGFDAVYYAYNSMNQVTSVRVADFYRQYQTWYGYDDNGRVDSIWSKLEDWRTGLVTGPFTNKMWHYCDTMPRPMDAEIVYTYTKAGQVDTMRYPKIKVFVDYAYNHRKWLDSIVARQSSGTIQPPDTLQLWKDVLTYDPAGQITSQTSQHNTPGSNPTQEYRYDGAQRLTGWYMGLDSTKYSYDAAGNRTTENWLGIGNPVGVRNTTSTFAVGVGGPNRLASAVSRDASNKLVAPGKYTYAYDANGGQVMATHHPLNGVGGDNREYAYSYRGLMRRVATGGWDSMMYEWRYSYSPAGEREQKRMYYAPKHDSVVNYPWTYYLLGNSGQQLAVYHGQQTSKTNLCGDAGRRVYMYPAEYLTYGIRGTANLTTLPTHQKRYVIADYLGSPRVVLDSGGAVISRFDYEPFGQAMPISGAVAGVRKSYIDRELDIESGLLNDGVRQKDGPRFTSTDLLWEKYPSLSPYVYAANNPIAFIDNDGKEIDFSDRSNPKNAKELFMKALNYLESKGVKEAVLLRALMDNKNFVIKLVINNNETTKYLPGGNLIFWNIERGYVYKDEDGNEQGISPAIALLHEGVHAFIHHLDDMRTDIFGGQMADSPSSWTEEIFSEFSQEDDTWRNLNEWYTCKFVEFPAAKQAGEVTKPRIKYTDRNDRLPAVPDVTASPEVTSTTKK